MTELQAVKPRTKPVTWLSEAGPAACHTQTSPSLPRIFQSVKANRCRFSHLYSFIYLITEHPLCVRHCPRCHWQYDWAQPTKFHTFLELIFSPPVWGLRPDPSPTHCGKPLFGLHGWGSRTHLRTSRGRTSAAPCATQFTAQLQNYPEMSTGAQACLPTPLD